MPQCFLDHRGLYVLGKHRQRSGNIIRDAIDAEIPQVSYKVFNAFDLDLNIHVRSKEKGPKRKRPGLLITDSLGTIIESTPILRPPRGGDKQEWAKTAK